jgi:hypothetical protein
MNNLLWFNSQGDALNLPPDPNTGIYTGTLFFEENSSDTYKTIGLYLFESVPSVSLQSINGDLSTQKFQLFNENRFTITGNSFFTQSVISIQASNNRPDFYSKWIYGNNFDTMYPVGSSIQFSKPVFEFVNPLETYTVTSVQKDAIMIISSTDNKSFTTLYSSLTFSNVYISGVNTIGIYDYRRGFIDELSTWNEQKFYNLVYNGKKLTIVNSTASSDTLIKSSDNNQIVTIQNSTLLDRKYWKYNINALSYTQSIDLNVTLTLTGDLPSVYNGRITLTGSSVYFSNPIPQTIFKPGIQFTIANSLYNSNEITVASIPNFITTNVLTYYATQSQTIWNNLIYQCLQSYTWTATSSINPDNSNYWTSSITYLPSQNALIYEDILNTQVHLVNNVFNYIQAYTQSNAVTMASFAQNYSSTFEIFDINLYYQNNQLNSDLIWSSNYAQVDYKIGTQSITNIDVVSEFIFSTNEILTPQINTNISENFNYSIVISSIDEFGIRFNINGQIYSENTEWVYNGLDVDQRKTIDLTLRNFVFNNFATLASLGVNIILDSYIYEAEFDFYKDTISFQTIYPNVPFNVSVKLGSLANYYVKNKQIIFNDLGSYLSININNKTYGQVVTSATSSYFSPDIATSLTKWVSNNYSTLRGYGIIVSNIRNILYLNTVDATTILNLNITTNKSSTPGISQWVIKDFTPGNFGILIAGNEVVLAATSSQSFEFSNFATGMVMSVNNTPFPYNNQEYGLIYVDTNQVGLSYQGPFFAETLNECTLSSFTTLAFSPLWYDVETCPPAISITGSSGAYDTNMYGNGFQINYIFTNSYDVLTYDSQNSNVKDLIYLNQYDSIYIGGENITVVTADTLSYITTINLPTSGIIRLIYNSFNNYIYALTNTNILIIDPASNSYVTTINIIPFDILVNQSNGDVYITDGSSSLSIFYSNNFTPTANVIITLSGAGKIEYNIVDEFIYVIGNSLYQINATFRTLESTIAILNPDNNYIFTEPEYGSVYIWGNLSAGISNTLFKYLNGIITSISLTNSGNNKLIYDNFTGDLFLSQQTGNKFSRITSNDVIVYTQVIDYGDFVISQFDGDIYLISNSGCLYVIDSNTGFVKYNNTTSPFGVVSYKLIYDPERESIIIGQYSGNLMEIQVELNSSITLAFSHSTVQSINDGYYGTLNSSYEPINDIWLKTRQYLRDPRYNYSNSGELPAQFVYKFIDDQTPQIFMYDVSGNQLLTGTSYSYIGPKPLENAVLNSSPNMDLSLVSDPTAQQTIFSEIKYTLDYLDSSTDISLLPTPLELFLGYNNINEGYDTTTLKMYMRWDVSLTINYNSILSNDITFTDKGTSSTYPNGYGYITFDINSTESFLYKSDGSVTGLQAGQSIQLSVTDVTNLNNKYLSMNNGQQFIIDSISNNQIVVEYIINSYGYKSYLTDENTIITNYPQSGGETYLQVTFTTIDREVASMKLYGQTEIEDVRYAIELYNSGGHVINPEDAFIFKTYDINEGGVDWRFLNKKRKEMLIVRNQIFPYVGSYRAIINAINYFGYNDLVLNEYYRNININSPNFYKLFKVQIPDIFQNNTGFTVMDYIADTMPNPNFEETNLLNLTFPITDFYGNWILLYSLDEIIIKLQGLKNWLEAHVIPIQFRILDISGDAHFPAPVSIIHKPFSKKTFKVSQTMTPIDFDMNEAYLMPVNSGSTVYNAVIDFKCSKTQLDKVPNYFTILIRTYKTYKEWDPFIIYSIGDEVTYYGKIYESAINNNKLNNPTQYDYVNQWYATTEYFNGQLVNYNNHIYEYLGTESSFIVFATQSSSGTYSIPTPYQSSLWLDISQWIQQDLVPVQTIFEYRNVDINSLTYSESTYKPLFYPNNPPELLTIQVSKPFNFSVDSNIDPFITIEVTSDNGYGLTYTYKKNYEIRGLNDLSSGIQPTDSIGPFTPINPITNHI